MATAAEAREWKEERNDIWETSTRLGQYLLVQMIDPAQFYRSGLPLLTTPEFTSHELSAFQRSLGQEPSGVGTATGQSPGGSELGRHRGQDPPAQATRQHRGAQVRLQRILGPDAGRGSVAREGREELG